MPVASFPPIAHTPLSRTLKPAGPITIPGSEHCRRQAPHRAPAPPTRYFNRVCLQKYPPTRNNASRRISAARERLLGGGGGGGGGVNEEKRQEIHEPLELSLVALVFLHEQTRKPSHACGCVRAHTRRDVAREGEGTTGKRSLCCATCGGERTGAKGGVMGSVGGKRRRALWFVMVVRTAGAGCARGRIW